MIYRTLHRKWKIEQHEPHDKNKGDLRCSGGSSSCSTIGTCRVTLLINPMISHFSDLLNIICFFCSRSRSFFRLVKHNLFFSVPDPDAYLTADFSEILNNIRLALLSVSPKSHYYSGFLSRSLPFLYLHLPSCIGDKVMSVMVNWFEFVPKALSQQKVCHW